MEKIYDTLKKGMSLYDAFKDVLDKQKAHDLLYIKNAYKDGYEEDKIDQVYREYEMNITKLEYVKFNSLVSIRISLNISLIFSASNFSSKIILNVSK